MRIGPREQSLIGQAVLAPSSHNTQPWRFRVGAAFIDLLADRRRALAVNDPHDRELVISCGAALMTLRVAAATRGIALAIERLPDPAEPSWLARVRLGAVDADTPSASDALAALDRLIARRRTLRTGFSARAIEPDLADQLVEAAAAEGAWLRPVPAGALRAQVAELVADGDRRQWANRHWRRELAGWMRPRHQGLGLGVPTLIAPIARWAVAGFDLGGRVGAQDRRLTEAAPLLLLLGTDEDAPSAWLRAGEALQRVLLLACAGGLQAGYLNQPIQVAELRPRLQSVTGGGSAQILLRLGYPDKAPAASARQPIAAVIEEPVPSTDDVDRGAAE